VLCREQLKFSGQAPQRFVHVQNIGRGHHILSYGPTILILDFLHMEFPHFRRLIWENAASLDKFMKIFEKLTWSLSYNKNPYRLFCLIKLLWPSEIEKHVLLFGIPGLRYTLEPNIPMWNTFLFVLLEPAKSWNNQSVMPLQHNRWGFPRKSGKWLVVAGVFRIASLFLDSGTVPQSGYVPRLRNKLPQKLRSSQSLLAFKRNLKTSLFTQLDSKPSH
jgi:hypothetical protein